MAFTYNTTVCCNAKYTYLLVLPPLRAPSKIFSLFLMFYVISVICNGHLTAGIKTRQLRFSTEYTGSHRNHVLHGSDHPCHVEFTAFFLLETLLLTLPCFLTPWQVICLCSRKAQTLMCSNLPNFSSLLTIFRQGSVYPHNGSHSDLKKRINVPHLRCSQLKCL